MFTEIQHTVNVKDIKALQEMSEQIVTLNQELQESKKIIQDFFKNKNEKTLLEDSIYHIKGLIKQLNYLRENFFYKFSFLPKEFHYTLAIDNNQVLNIVPDELSFKNAQYKVESDILQKICDEKAMVLMPLSAVKDKINLAEDLKKSIRNKSNLFVLLSAKHLDIGECLNSSYEDLSSAIVPQKIINKWEAFTFQLPLYQQINQKISALQDEVKIMKKSFSQMSEVIHSSLKRQEAFNYSVIKNLNIVLKEVNHVGEYIHNQQGLDKNRVVKIQDLNNPQQERREEGLDPYINDWGYEMYRSSRVYYVTVYPWINVTLYGKPYERNLLSNCLNPNITSDLERLLKKKESDLIVEYQKQSDNAFMILQKSEADEFKVLTAFEGVDLSWSILFGTELLLSETKKEKVV